MSLHKIQPQTDRKKRKRVGRGGKRGSYSGKGQKGQKSRAGRKLRPQLRDIIKRIPKKRGYRFKSINKQPVMEINLDILEKNFENGDKVTPEILLEKKLIKKFKGRLPEVKILGRGILSKKITISGCIMSKSVEAQMKK